MSDPWWLLRERPDLRGSAAYQAWVLNIRMRRFALETVRALHVPQLVDWLARRLSHG